jgi:hypothetical protein
MGVLLSTTIAAQDIVQQIALTAIIYTASFSLAFAGLTRFLRYIFPELAFAIVSRIPLTLKSSTFWRKLIGE